MPRYLERLDACKSLEDFRKAAANLDLDIHSKLVFSESAFRQLLVSECKLEVFLQFLSDPFLNARESQNLQRLWGWYMKESRNRIDSMCLHNWLRNHISLGMLSKKELEDLVNTSGNYPEMGLCQTILDGLVSSAVYQVSDLDDGILNRLLLSASCDDCWHNPEVQSLSFKILEACKPPQYRNMVEGISSLLTSYLLSESLDSGIYFLERQVFKTLDRLLLRSKIQASKAIASASKAALKRFESSTSTRSLLKRNLSGWWSFLLHHEKSEFIRHRPEWLRIEHALARHDIDILCLYLKHLSDDEKCVFLLRHWFTQDAGDGDIFRPGSLPDSVRLFQDGLVSRTGTTCPFVFLFHYLGPGVSTAGIMLPRLFFLLNELEMHETSLALFSYIRQSKITVDLTALAKKIINSTSINPQVACTLFKITPSLPLESCPAVAETMIYHPGWNPGVPLGFLDLRQESLGVSDVYPHTSQEICRTQIELLNRMALAYAHASHIYPRVALRQVYHCYQLLLRRHGRSSLGVDISRAFTVAGIIRPLQKSQWVGMEKLNFILRIVRKIEGDQVASRVDELIYMWRDELIRKKAEKASKMQLSRSLGLDDVEVNKEVEWATETPRVGKRKAEAPRIIAGEPLELLPGEMNADGFVRVHGALNLARARTVQNTALKENGIAEGASMQMIQGLGGDMEKESRLVAEVFSQGKD